MIILHYFPVEVYQILKSHNSYNIFQNPHGLNVILIFGLITYLLRHACIALVGTSSGKLSSLIGYSLFGFSSIIWKLRCPSVTFETHRLSISSFVFVFLNMAVKCLRSTFTVTLCTCCFQSNLFSSLSSLTNPNSSTTRTLSTAMVQARTNMANCCVSAGLAHILLRLLVGFSLDYSSSKLLFVVTMGSDRL